MSIESGLAVPRSPVSVAVTLRGHTLIQDKPRENGGADQGPMASEFLLASLLACQHSTFFKVAAKRKIDATVAALHGDMHFDANSDISALHVRFEVKAPATVSDDAILTAMRLTDKTCTISRVLKVAIDQKLVRVA